MQRIISKLEGKGANILIIILVSLGSGAGSGTLVDYLQADQKLWVMDYVEEHFSQDTLKTQLERCEKINRHLLRKTDELGALIAEMKTKITLVSHEIIEVGSKVKEINSRK